MRPLPSNGSPTQNGETKCGMGNQGEDDLIKEFKFLELSFRKNKRKYFYGVHRGFKFFLEYEYAGPNFDFKKGKMGVYT